MTLGLYALCIEKYSKVLKTVGAITNSNIFLCDGDRYLPVYSHIPCFGHFFEYWYRLSRLLGLSSEEVGDIEVFFDWLIWKRREMTITQLVSRLHRHENKTCDKNGRYRIKLQIKNKNVLVLVKEEMKWIGL